MRVFLIKAPKKSTECEAVRNKLGFSVSKLNIYKDKRPGSANNGWLRAEGKCVIAAAVGQGRNEGILRDVLNLRGSHQSAQLPAGCKEKK